MKAIVVEHNFTKSLIPCLIMRNGYERIWVSFSKWKSFGFQKYYELKFSGTEVEAEIEMDEFNDWQIKRRDFAYQLLEDRDGIFFYQNETKLYHCWCAAMDDYLEQNGFNLTNITDKVHIYVRETNNA